MINWIQKIDLGNGEITPGTWHSRADKMGLDKISFQNKTVLDIGCLDGQYSFYAEQHGAARIVSVDIGDEQFGKQENPSYDGSAGFKYAHAKLKSKAEYRYPFSVYQLRPDTFGLFDIVLFLGVIYHLAHPAAALERINEALKLGGQMVLEGETRFSAHAKINSGLAWGR